MANYPFEPIAIIGMSALFAGSQDSRGFWRDLMSGKDLTGDIPTTHWLVEDYYDPDPKTPDKIYVKRGSFLDKIPFDPIELVFRRRLSHKQIPLNY
jgi:acyl transferase domain-containing protein